MLATTGLALAAVALREDGKIHTNFCEPLDANVWRIVVSFDWIVLVLAPKLLLPADTTTVEQLERR